MITKGKFIALLGLVLFMSYAPIVEATSNSTNFRIDESVVGGSGQNFSQSANYQTLQSSGVLGTDTSLSTNFQSKNGAVTTGDPALTFTINSGAVGFGDFSATAASTATGTFEVTNYTSYGYIVQIIGNPPKSSSGHSLTTLATASPSQVGVEQFGINLVANTSPSSVGANPNLGQFGIGGTATANYGTSNQYRYVNGDTIASAPKSSGKTIYTISYLVNVNPLTPAGQYTTNQTLICTGTY